MTAILERNLKLFFKNRAGVFFSVLGPLIVLGLYVIFLKQNMLAAWSAVPHAQKLLDPWLIGGMLAVTAMTTTLSGLRQLVDDQEHAAVDFEITPVSPFVRQMGYFLSATIIGILMQLVVFGVDMLYFGWADNLVLTAGTIVKVVGLIFINAIVAACLNGLLVSLFKTRNSLSTFETIIGTLSGFLSGIYVPIGDLPDKAQTLIKFYPGAYSASLYRRALMAPQLDQTFSAAPTKIQTHFEHVLGVGYNLHFGATTFMTEMLIFIGCGLLAILVVLVKSWLPELRLRRVRYNNGNNTL
ncbi:ABC transporter permease [Furfurilactobacillus siliginis]|uniref:Permease n=1 Tax=Furfurilactobacillus siliginis TaxID=348151 RepID=A0A0R2L4C6_9LACO|nr:ABC transporter permease [Furfurilactobacillus siliginis]KRN96417.1 ABC-type multidrug transport system, permease component [Furfurilactobacillus siliginis]GEK29201.1 permease [Furfurilactobacillus siliginis]